MNSTRAVMMVALLALASGCVPGRRGLELPEPGPPVTPELPPIPTRAGPLSLELVYPFEDGRVSVRDSTFVFGSTGTGEAQLRINGLPVEVKPNGAFLAFLPVPEDGVYELVATAGGRTARLERRVDVPAPPPTPPPGEPLIVDGSAFPRGAWTALPEERIEVGFRGTAGGRAALVFSDGTRIPLIEERAVETGVSAFVDDPTEPMPREAGTPALSNYRGYFVARPLLARDTALARPTIAPLPRRPPVRAAPPLCTGPEGERPVPCVPPPEQDTAAIELLGEEAQAVGNPPPERPGSARAATATLELVVAGDTARTPLPLNLALLDPDRPPVARAVLRGEQARTRGKVRANAGPIGTWIYLWPARTKLYVTGERYGEYRVRLAPTLDAWIDTEEVRLLPPGTPPPDAQVGTVRFYSEPRTFDIRIALDERVPFQIEAGENSLTVTLYNATGNTSRLMYGSLNPFIERAEWSQPAGGIYELRLTLAAWPWGYKAFWTENDNLVVRVRRPPRVDLDDPLAGLTIAVDPGHPPGGAIGPTGLTEAEVNLAIALELREMLRDAGATVVMTRTDTGAVPIYERVQLAIERDAHLLVSIHNNAFPDGVNPYENAGTSVYYFHPHSAGLARAFQRHLLAELELRDLGIGRASLALVRNPTWMPSALTETAFLMIPRQEAALRDPEVQERIARAHLEAMREFVRRRALER